MIKNANDNSKNEENIDNADRTGNNGDMKARDSLSRDI
jgi:hypothetical protein